MVGVRGVNVTDLATRFAHTVMMVVDIRVETRGTAQLNLLQLAHRGEVGERLVHGPQRDAGHFRRGDFIKGLGGRVHVVAVKKAEEQLPLRRDLQSRGTE